MERARPDKPEQPSGRKRLTQIDLDGTRHYVFRGPDDTEGHVAVFLGNDGVPVAEEDGQKAIRMNIAYRRYQEVLQVRHQHPSGWLPSSWTLS